MKRMFVLFAVLISAIIAAPAAQASPLGDVMTNADMTAQGAGLMLNRNSGKCLEIVSSSSSNGARAQQWQCVGQPGSAWRRVPVTDTAFAIVNHSSGKCLEVQSSSASDGAPVQQWDCVNQAGAYWEAYLAPEGFVYIVNVNSGKCLEIQSSATHNGAPAQQYQCHDLPTMHWTRPPV